MRKPELIEAVYLAAAAAEGFRSVEGILEIGNEGYGWIRTGNYMEGDGDAFVHQQMIRSLGLRPGDRVAGTVGPGRNNSKYPPLQSVASVNGRPVEGLKSRPRFRDLTPIFPNERLVMEHGRDSVTGRAIDLVSPIGKGQRGLIVSPPKAGKTTVLKKICQSIAANNPEVHLFCLLVDERPEEVTDMKRSIKGEVVASTFDMPADNHTHVSELVIEHAKRLVELGEDVVVVLDSITRLARAYNLAQPASGRILSGGVDSAALYPPKKFLGARPATSRVVARSRSLPPRSLTPAPRWTRSSSRSSRAPATWSSSSTATSLTAASSRPSTPSAPERATRICSSTPCTSRWSGASAVSSPT